MANITIIEIILMALGCAGFTLAAHIYHRKRQKKPLVCPLHAKCELVTHSTYSKFLGIPIELLGMCYYASIVLFYGYAAAGSEALSVSAVHILLMISGLAFLFSMYLVSLQAFVLKQWCTWCLCSAALCVAVFFVTLFALPAVIFR